MVSREEIVAYMRKAAEVGRRAKELGHHPFGCILVGPEGDILLHQGNYSQVHHAESEICRVAVTTFPQDYLRKCTLYTSVEPCCMCAGSCYWAYIGTIVYGMSEERLATLTKNSKENPTLRLPSRQVIAAGSRDIQVIGPIAEVEDEIAQDHIDFWDSH